jgi:hypothetical protein
MLASTSIQVLPTGHADTQPRKHQQPQSKFNNTPNNAITSPLHHL